MWLSPEGRKPNSLVFEQNTIKLNSDEKCKLHVHLFCLFWVRANRFKF